MGWSFRRSTRIGPFRLNFSRSGIGVSAGVRGARISTGPRGTYINLGTNGFHYREKIGGGYSRGSASVAQPVNDPNNQLFESVPTNLNYPTFPKHGPPRIVITLGLWSIPILIVSVWILAVVLAGTNSFGSTSISPNYNLRSDAGTPGNKLIQSSRDRGFQAGFDYALRDRNAIKGKNFDERHVKELSAEIFKREFEGKDWQQGWMEGYKKAFESINTPKANHNNSSRDQTASREIRPKTSRELSRTANNGYIRGPRGGCYYLSGSGRKVYVDRGFCN